MNYPYGWGLCVLLIMDNQSMAGSTPTRQAMAAAAVPDTGTTTNNN